MIDVSIPQFKQIESGDEKAYTVFVIEVCAAGRRHTLEKRYSELHTLHRELKKTYLTPEFPPKRVRNWNPKVLEQRRRGLETYLQGLIHQDILPKILLDFLEINMATQLGYEEIDGISTDRNKASHQPVLSFSADSFLHPSQKGGLPDIVVVGVSQALDLNLQ
ncbi:Sorting nexin-24 [Branchiostoma belcheri]|nr:Sorting nexin-24 [Branchiostoma belcheri]